MKTYEYRLKPNKTQEEGLQKSLDLTRNLYNLGLEEIVNYYKETGKSLNRFTQDKMHDSKTDPDIYSPLIDTTIARLHNSFGNFFRNIKNGRKTGFPRFKSFTRWHGFDFRDNQSNKIINGYFNSGKKVAGKIKVIEHRPMDGKFIHARIVKKPSGWYVQCICELDTKPLPKTNKDIGIDVGIKYLIADSDGGFVENDKTLRKSLPKIRIKQRELARKKIGSKNREKTRRELSRVYERIANKRKDYIHKATTKIVSNNDSIAMEDLNIRGMVKNHHLSLSIIDASWGMIKNMLAYKAESAGRQFVLVPPQYTSQKCSECGEIVQKSLSVRTHLCPFCGYIDDRDTNAAKNILRLGRSLWEASYAKA